MRQIHRLQEKREISCLGIPKWKRVLHLTMGQAAHGLSHELSDSLLDLAGIISPQRQWSLLYKPNTALPSP